jgi:hypothetical protein
VVQPSPQSQRAKKKRKKKERDLGGLALGSSQTTTVGHTGSLATPHKANEKKKKKKKKFSGFGPWGWLNLPRKLL